MAATAVELVLERGPEQVRRARRFTVDTLADVPRTLAEDAQLVVAELVTNAVLHGAAPISLRLHAQPAGVRVEVTDAGGRLPVRVRDAGDAMTGRGLALVAALTTAWGIRALPDGGKTVWADLGAGAGELPAPPGEDRRPVGGTTHRPKVELYPVELGDVPTDLLMAAKAHVDNLVREFTLASARSGTELAPPLARLAHSVTREFASARNQIKEQALAAAAAGHALTHLSLRLPLAAAELGERYLAALDEADRYSRAARLLTLETPPAHQVFRRWYVQSLVDQLRARGAGRQPPTTPTFAERLAEEYATVVPLRETAARLELMQRVTAELTAAVTVADVAGTVVRQARDALGADIAVVYLLDAEGVLAEIGRSGTSDPDLASTYGAFPADADLPAGRALRTGEVLVFRDPEQLAEQFPRLAARQPAPAGSSLLVAPLVTADRPVGVLALRFPGSALVEENRQRDLVATLAGLTAQALDRALAASAAAEAAERLQFLAEASVVLASSVDHRTVLQAVADLVVPRLADWCVIQLLDRDSLLTVALAHTDPQRTAWAWSLRDRYPTDLDAPTGAPNVIRTGRSELYPEISEAMIEQAEADPERRRLLRGLGIVSALVVPLTGRSGVIGALTMIQAESGRHYRGEDVRTAEDLARRAALAVETATAFREQSGRLAELARVAEAAQHAILTPPPPRARSLALAARYVSAAAEALIGGDLYEVVERRGAVRLLIGDVRGKGLDAVRVATVVLGEFRAAADETDDLTEVARQLDRRAGRYLGEEDFVTALVVDVADDGSLTAVNCGHPPPLLSRAGKVRELDCRPTLPLGLGVDPRPTNATLRHGDRLLLYTDGLLEARDLRKRFVDMSAVTRSLGSAPLDTVLDRMLADLRGATGGALADDLALLLAEFRGG